MTESKAEVKLVLPADDTERAICDIFKEILNLDGIGTAHNFFDIGGHSMAVLRAISLIQKRLDISIRVPQFYENPTPGQLANLIKLKQQPAHYQE
jgi:acyl carrier protein